MSDETLTDYLARAVRTHPNRCFLKVDGAEISFGEFESRVAQLAQGLAQAGLGRGDRLLVMLPNCREMVECLFAAARLGAVWAPINIDFRGRILMHVVATTEPTLTVCESELVDSLVDALRESGQGHVPLFVRGRERSHEALDGLYQDRHPEPVITGSSELACLLFTSGTTGHSKACMLPHRYFLAQARIAVRDFGWRSDDVFYCPFPLFHADCSVFAVAPALVLGATAAIGRRFSASKFWTEVRSVGATVFEFMGATLAILAKAEPSAADRDHQVRQAWGVPVPSWADAFEERFGLQLVEVYGSTEAGIPVTTRWDRPRVAGSCGRVIPEYDLIIADDLGWPLPPGEVGEILVRPREPSLMFSGYFGMPTESLKVCRDLWFHSGDFGRIDGDGNIFFMGRKKDAIRRRGENISAAEIEEVIEMHPDVRLCAAIGVPSELTEEDLKVCIELRTGTSLSEEGLIAYCERSLARFQVPRYVEFMAELPRTPTDKIAKAQLRENPLTPRTWDRQADQPRRTVMRQG